MVWSVRTLLLAAAVTCTCASFAVVSHAQTNDVKPPVPKEAPPRVPFSAFRMKPILDSQLEKKSGSLVVQDMDKPYKPKGEMHILKPKVSVSKPGKAPKIVPLQLPPARQAEENARKLEAQRKKKEEAARAAAAKIEAENAKLPPHIEEVPAQTVKPVSITKLETPLPQPKPVTLPEGQPPQDTRIEQIDNDQENISIKAPKPVPLEELVELDRLTAVFVNGVPVPAPKPTGRQIVRESGHEETQNILATPSEGSLPRPPVSEGVVNTQNRALSSAEMAAQSINPIIAAPKPVNPADVYVPVPKGGATERIRDRRRFGSQDRMGGEGSGLAGNEKRSPSRLSSLGLPADMRNLRIGKLDDADGVSPVLLPGHTQIVAAPDTVRMDKRGLPNDVIVFFQENSREMEVGQMDIIQSDVLAILKDRPDLDLEIVGYSEPQKDGEATTKKMALARALMIRDFLSRQHIDSHRLTVKGEGDDTSIEPRDRVEMYFSR